MNTSNSIAFCHTADVKWRLGHIRVARLFLEQHRLYVWGPQLVAVTAFLYGREYGRWESAPSNRSR